MITDDKVIEIFFIIYEFCKEFEQEMSKQPVLGSDGVRRRNRKANMSHSEIMTINREGAEASRLRPLSLYDTSVFIVYLFLANMFVDGITLDKIVF